MRLLRAVAVAIAVAGLIDPVWTSTAPPSRELIAIDLTDAASDRVVADLQAAAPRWHVVPRRVEGTRVPCGPDERCVVIADGSLDATVPGDVGALSLITLRQSSTPNVALRSAIVAAGHASAAGAVRVEVSRSGAIPSTEIRVRDGEAIVGSVTHTWGDETAATIEVPWWPIGSGTRALRIEVVSAGDAVAIDNVLDVGATVDAAPIPVLVFETRPSWGSTFVRRALEDDARFVVRHRARLAPGLTAGTSTGSLDAATLEHSPVVVVGGPDALTASDVALLERYVVQRGGSLALLPERQVDGPARRLVGDGWSEQLVPEPQRIGVLRATEILRLDRAPVAGTVIGAYGSSPSIVVLPTGRGRVIVSGAMDAWRYRDAGNAGAFDRFWTSLVAEAAAEGMGLRIDLETALAAKGERVPFTLRYRTLDARESVEARVTMRCGNVATAVRVWPSGELDEFTGDIPALENGQCEIAATVGSLRETTALTVTDRPHRGVDRTLDQLARTTRALGGVVVEAGKESDLAAAMDDSTAESSQIVSVRPMRSAWWIVPFAGFLSVEWWLRRRNGLR